VSALFTYGAFHWSFREIRRSVDVRAGQLGQDIPITARQFATNSEQEASQ
jgi:hypothetical protein